MVKVRVKRKVSRRRRRERAVAVALSCACCVFIVYAACSLIVSRTTTTTLSGGAQQQWAPQKQQQRLGERAALQKVHEDTPMRHGERRREAAFAHSQQARHDRGGLLRMRDALEDPSSDPAATEMARKILSASVNLIDIEMRNHHEIEDDTYSGIVATFCAVDFGAQKSNPPELPMFRDVVHNSGCDAGDDERRHKHGFFGKQNSVIRVDLKEAVDLAREFDSDNESHLPALLDLRGVVFHESRCGSTLAANSMLALDPSRHRVYSESGPPATAMRACGEDYSECSVEASANLLRDVVYMMGRSGDPREENLFFKFQSVTTRTLGTFRAAFPTTPWIFLYRDPVEVMTSQLDVPGGRTSQANCVRSRHSSAAVAAYIKESKWDFADFSDEEFCAVHLATLCESARRNLQDADGLGMALRYHPDLVHDFLDTVFPRHFHTPVTADGRDRVLKVSGTYSKNRGRHAEGDFVSDKEEKERKATREIREASDEILKRTFDMLEKSEYNIRPVDGDDET